MRTHPGTATLHDIGTSRLEETLRCLSIGDESASSSVVFAMPHPNEPIGGLADALRELAKAGETHA